MRAILFIYALIFILSHSSSAMEYVELCKSQGDCKKFSRLVMGTDHLIQADWVEAGWPQYSDAKVFEILDHAAELGINFFDTSPIYVGGVEYRLGLWREKRKQSHPQEEHHVLSKGGFPFDLKKKKKLPQGTHSPELLFGLKDFLHQKYPAGTYASRLYGSQDLIAERVAEEMEHTTKNLKGAVTIYLMHRDDGDSISYDPILRKQTPVETIMEALSQISISQNTWLFGWSNWMTDRVEESIELAQSRKDLIQPVINSPYFSLFEMSERTIHALGVQVTHSEMMDPHFQEGIKIMPYSPLGGFSILDKPEPKWENAKKAAREKYQENDPYWKNVYHALFTQANEERWLRLVKFTQEFNQKHKSNYSLDQMMNAYVLAHPRTDFMAIGPITQEQLDRTVRSLGLSKLLTAQDLEYLYSGQVYENDTEG
ncbi:MAG: aldo/keto reductase [Bdellovibrionales bacterium]|nr:aldo/keto reductase [Bdellovibrionales bacterium]